MQAGAGMHTFTESDMTTIIRALAYAAGHHSNQKRKGENAEPYINHLIDVLHILWEIGEIRDITTLTAALLHDAVEDTDVTAEELTELFGEEISDIVMEVTDNRDLAKEHRKRLQVEHAAHLSTEASFIKLADKISNISDIISAPPSNWSRKQQRAYVAWGKEVIDRLRGIHPQLEKHFDIVYEEAQQRLAD